MFWESKHFKGSYLSYDWSHGSDCQLNPSVHLSALVWSQLKGHLLNSGVGSV